LVIFRVPVFEALLVVDVFATLALSTVLLLSYSLFTHEFGLSPREAGVMLGTLAVGSFAAALLVARGAKAGLSKLFGIGALCAGGGTLLLALSNGRPLVGGAGPVLIGSGVTWTWIRKTAWRPAAKAPQPDR
jgi:hypothetical protein